MDEEIHDQHLVEMFANFASDELYLDPVENDNIVFSQEYKDSLRKAISDPSAEHRTGQEAEFDPIYRQSAVVNELLDRENSYEFRGSVWNPQVVEKLESGE